MDSMSLGAILVALLAVGSLGALLAGRISLDFLGVGLIVVLVASDVVPLDKALAGFGNATIVTLASLYVIAEGLTRTGALDFVARAVLATSHGSELRLLTTLCVSVALISAIASNTAVILVFLPIAVSVAGQLGVPVSRLLMPMAFASLFGGTLTLVGSSINLLTSSAAEQFGAAPLGMFEMTPLAAPLCAAGVVLTVLLSRRLLPDRFSLTAALAAAPSREYVTEFTVGSESPLVGRAVEECFEGKKIQPLFLVRDEAMLPGPFADERLEAGDVVMLQGNVSKLLDLQSSGGLELLGDARFDPHTMILFELAVAPRSGMVGRRIGELHLWRDFGVLVVAVLRGNHHIRRRATELILQPGDVLLVSGPEESQARLRASADFYLLSGGEERVVLRKHAARALWILAAVIGLFSIGALAGLSSVIPIPLVAMGGAAAMVTAGCLSPRQAYRGIDWPILVFIVGALALGEAFQATGLAENIAHGVVGNLHGLGPAAVASGLLFVGTLLNQVTSPYAVTVLLTPIAISAAQQMGLADSRIFILAIAFSGSNAFGTPFGHQVNLMVMGPGGYRFSDFVRFGMPLCLFFWLFLSGGLALLAP